MKRIIAAIAILAVVLSLTACNLKKKELSAEEFQSSVAAEEARRAQESLQAEIEYSQGVIKEGDKIGKTEKNKRIVVKIDVNYGTEYEVFVMNKKGVIDYKLLYQFFDDLENYNTIVKYKDTDSKKQVDHDEKARLIVYKFSDMVERTYDEVYNDYKSLEGDGYTIIE